jgi:hypothetical protein
MSDLQTPQSGPTPTGNPKADAKAAKAYAKASRPWYKKKRYWLLAFVLLIVMISVASGGGGGADESASDSGDTSSASDDSGSESNEPAEEKAEPAEKPMKVEAKKILKEFDENEAAADGKYDGKVLQVSGVVDKIDTEVWDDDQYVIRVGAGTQFDFITVNCNDQSQSDVTSIKKGQDITVVGKFDDGGDLGVELKDCKVA